MRQKKGAALSSFLGTWRKSSGKSLLPNSPFPAAHSKVKSPFPIGPFPDYGRKSKP